MTFDPDRPFEDAYQGKGQAKKRGGRIVSLSKSMWPDTISGHRRVTGPLEHCVMCPDVTWQTYDGVSLCCHCARIVAGEEGLEPRSESWTPF